MDATFPIMNLHHAHFARNSYSNINFYLPCFYRNTCISIFLVREWRQITSNTRNVTTFVATDTQKLKYITNERTFVIHGRWRFHCPQTLRALAPHSIYAFTAILMRRPCLHLPNISVRLNLLFCTVTRNVVLIRSDFEQFIFTILNNFF
jgi:hypothetical protein